MLTADQLRVKALLTETIMLLCKNGLHFKSEFSIEGLIGITLDGNEIFLVNINETVHHRPEDLNELDRSQAVGSNEPSTFRKIPRKRRKSSQTPDRVLPPKPNAETSMRSDPDFNRCSEDLTQWTTPDPHQSSIKLEVSRSGPCRFQNHGHSLENVDTPGSKTEITDSLQMADVQRNLGDWKEHAVASDHTTSSDFDPQLAVQDVAEPARKRLLSDCDAGNAANRKQRQFSASNSDEPDRPDADVIHVKEETASDEDLSHSENSFAGYLGLYGVDASQGYPVPAADQHPMQMSSDVLLPGCSTWNRRGGNVHPSSPQTASCSSTFLASSSRSRLLWNRTVQGAADDASGCKSGFEIGLDLRPSLVGKPNPPQLTKKYQCPYCGMRFSATSNLRGHLVHHTGIKEFMCTVCKKEFQYKQALKRHSVKCFQEIPQMAYSG